MSRIRVFSGGFPEWVRSIWMLYVACKETVHTKASGSGRAVSFQLKDTGQVNFIISVHSHPDPAAPRPHHPRPHAFCLILIIIAFEFILFY